MIWEPVLTQEMEEELRVAEQRVLEMLRSEGRVMMSQPLEAALGNVFTVLKDIAKGHVYLIFVQLDTYDKFVNTAGTGLKPFT